MVLPAKRGFSLSFLPHFHQQNVSASAHEKQFVSSYLESLNLALPFCCREQLGQICP